MGEEAAMSDKDNKDSIDPQILKAAAADRIKQGLTPIQQALQQFGDELKQAAENMKQIQPFLDAIFEAFPGEEWYLDQAVSVIMAPVSVYMKDKGLTDGADIDTHKAPFLAFFKDYIDRLEAAYNLEKQRGNDLDINALQAAVFKQLAGAGVITSLGGRQLSITDVDYQFALTPLRNSKAYITPLRESIMQKLTFENGQLSILDSGIEPADLKTKNGLQDIKTLDLPLLRQVFSAVYNTAIEGDAHTITVHIPSFCREMGIDVRSVPAPEEYKGEGQASSNPGKLNDVFGKLRQFENCIGITKSGYYELLRAIVIEPGRNTITFATPYMNHIFREIRDKNIIRDREGKELYINPGYSRLMYSTIANERNKTAVEIVNRIITGLQQRGAIPDAKLKQNKRKRNIPPIRISYKITYNGIIDGIPTLTQTLETSSTANKNVQLARAFEKAFELLRTKTDVYQYYINLKIPETAPTTTTLTDTMAITHEGVNGEYKPRI